MVEIKITVTQMKNAFNELISRSDMAKERVSKLRAMSIETSQNTL